MKNLKSNFQDFGEWANTYHTYPKKGEIIPFKSGYQYIRYMHLAEEDLNLGSLEFYAKHNPGILQQLLDSLTDTSGFQRRDVKIQSDIISAFTLYLRYHGREPQKLRA